MPAFLSETPFADINDLGSFGEGSDNRRPFFVCVDVRAFVCHIGQDSNYG